LELIPMNARLLALAAVLPLSVACQSAFAASGGPAPKPLPAELLPQAKAALEVAGGDSKTSLAHLLQQLSAATGVTFTATDDVRQMLASSSCGVLASTTVPPAEAWVWTESLLQNEGFVLGILSANAPWLVAVYPQQPTGGRFRSLVYFTVPSAEIEALAEHPTLLVSTVLDLPHTDVRQLGNSLRGLTTDPTGSQNVIPVGNTNSVILTGHGRQVLQLVTMLREVDAAMAQVQPPAAPASASPGTAGGNPPR
jgi:type II secretory pathway component GspD/PulD (secretin)